MNNEKTAGDMMLNLQEMINARIIAFCRENSLCWHNQTMEFVRSSKIMEGFGHSEAIKVTVTFSAYLDDEPYRSALGYGSDTPKEAS